MTLYETIDLYCRKGLYPMVTNGEKFCIVSPHKDPDGYWRDSAEHNNSEDTCSKRIGDCNGYSKEEWDGQEEKGWKFHSVHETPVEHYEVGDKVDTLESVKNHPNYKKWDESKQKMVGQKGLKIREVFDNFQGLHYELWNKDKTDHWYFRHEWLVPHIETEDILVKDGKKYRVQILEEIK